MQSNRRLALAMMVAALTACGGGGGDTSPSTPSDTTPTTTPSPTTPSTTTPSTTTSSSSYWQMDDHNYTNGGYTAQSAGATGSRAYDVAVFSTATLGGGDTSNGAYSGSALTFVHDTNGAGTYTVVPSRTAFITAAAGSNLIVVEAVVGAAVNTGATQYTAASGTVTITVDTAGKPHYATTAALPMAKTMDVAGGVAGAPASMQLTIVDVH